MDAAAVREQLQLRGDINQALVESGDHERIFTLLLDLLRSSGWYESTRNLCVDTLRASTVVPESNPSSPLGNGANDGLGPGGAGTGPSKGLDADADAEIDAEGEEDVDMLGSSAGTLDGAHQPPSSSQQQQQILRPTVTNYDTLYKVIEGMAWSTVPDDVKTEIVGEIKKVLEKILVEG